MKLRLKILSTIMSMCLALGVMGIAVWAAATQTLQVTNVINFTSIHVLATVTGVVEGAQEGTYTNYGPTSTLATDAEGKLGAWNIGDNTQFVDETENIEITITVLNNSTERSLSFEISDQAQTALVGVDLDDTNINRAVYYSINNATPVTDEAYAGGEVEVEAGATAVITFVIQITNTQGSVFAFDNRFNFTLRNVG